MTPEQRTTLIDASQLVTQELADEADRKHAEDYEPEMDDRCLIESTEALFAVLNSVRDAEDQAPGSVPAAVLAATVRIAASIIEFDTIEEPEPATV